jgi:hypothetical protein
MSSSTVVIDSSDESENESASENESDMINDPIMCVLSKFLVNDAGENIAVILTTLAKEMALLREAILSTKEK